MDADGDADTRGSAISLPGLRPDELKITVPNAKSENHDATRPSLQSGNSRKLKKKTNEIVSVLTQILTVKLLGLLLNI